MLTPGRLIISLALLSACSISPPARSSTAATQSPTESTSPLIYVGGGSAESSARQVVRTLNGYVYIAAVDDEGAIRNPAAATLPTVLRMYRSTTPGIPAAFTEMDGAHRLTIPLGAGESGSGGDARLDANGIIHVVGYRTDTGVTIYQRFSTLTDTWGAVETVTLVGGNQHQSAFIRGSVECGIALDASGTPFVATANYAGMRVYRRSGSGWVLDAAVTSVSGLHPSLTFDRRGRLHVAWLENDTTIRYAVRSTTGAWSTEVVASGSPSAVMSNSTLDQSPSLAVDGSDRPVVTYLSGTAGSSDNQIRVRWRDDSAVWHTDDPLYFTHDPAVYMRADKRYVMLGHDANIHPGYTSAGDSSQCSTGASVWAPVTIYQPTGHYDGSASVRFDPLYETDCSVVDVLAMNENGLRGSFYPDLYYSAVLLAGAQSGQGSCREITTIVADAGVPPDLSIPRDFATPLDMVVARDLLVARDLSAPRDLSTPRDFASAPVDLAVVRDLSVPRDLAMPRDLSAPRDLAIVRDMSTPRDLSSSGAVGATTIGPAGDYNPLGYAEAFQVTASATGAISALHVYLDSTSTSGTVTVGLYSDLSGSPRSLLASSSTSAPVAGAWNVLPLSASVVAGTRYWIAILGSRSGTVRFRDGIGGGPSQMCATSGLAALPVTWAPGSGGSDGALSAFGQ